MSERVIALLDEGLGNQAYLVDLGDGRALALDATVDLRTLDHEAATRGLRVVVAADTHLHADFLSGSTRLARRDGAVILGSALGGRLFEHVPMADGQAYDLGGLTLVGWTTPGHTDEHMSYLLMDGDGVLAAFTGGSLIVGSAARTDLVSPGRTDELARAQFRSLRRLAQLPDSTPVFPTHGAGSFCSAPPGADRITTIGREKATNALMALEDEDEFVARLLASLGTYPPYFRRLGAVNRDGVPDLDTGPLARLGLRELRSLHASGAEIVDVRPSDQFAAGHVPGSLAIALRPVLATWLGWMVPDDGTPLAFVRNGDQDPEEIVWQARKVGYGNLAGELDGGFATWADAGLPVGRTPLVDGHAVAGAVPLDIRQANEFASGHVPGAVNVELGDVTAERAPAGSLVTMCGGSDRAMTAASVLEREGREVSVLEGGTGAWARATGQELVT
ncbi:MAG: rhodanese-like domain-containing protein [Actinomycetota bacterium]|nr:rhodanese-like domain-containing protein [Actinomycetota bacterium]